MAISDTDVATPPAPRAPQAARSGWGRAAKPRAVRMRWDRAGLAGLDPALVHAIALAHQQAPPNRFNQTLRGFFRPHGDESCRTPRYHWPSPTASAAYG